MFIVKYELIINNNVYCWLQMWKHGPWELTDSFFCKISCLQSLKISLYWSNLIKQRMVEIDGDTWMFWREILGLFIHHSHRMARTTKWLHINYGMKALLFCRNAIESAGKAFRCFCLGAVDMQNRSVAELCVLIAASVGCKNYIIS